MFRLRAAKHLYSMSRRHLGTVSVQSEGIVVPGLSTRLPFSWLRDSCQCSLCVHPSTKQKLRESSSVPLDIRPAQTDGSVSLSDTFAELTVQWDPKFESDKKPHTSKYPLEFLKRYSDPHKLRDFHRDVDLVPWVAADVSTSGDLFSTYEDLDTPSGLLRAIIQLNRDGLLFVRGVPSEATNDDSCELPSLATRFGEIRETFYGRVWDVKNVKNSKNIAYTNLNLDLHMDLLYFQHPPRYQILHCLRNRVKGGVSIFVDAFKAAEQLYDSSKEAFDELSTTPVNFHYINDGHHLHQSHTTIELAPKHSTIQQATQSTVPKVSFVNYSPPFQAPLPINTPPTFYSALAQFAQLLRRPENRFEYLLKEGDAVLFDNRRILHARSAFEEWSEEERPNNVPKAMEGEASRWLKGCYLESDAVSDRMRVIRSKAE